MSYQLRLNGKTWKTINGKRIRNLIYNGTVYEIAKSTKWPGYLTFSSDNPFSITITTDAEYDGLLEYSTDTTTWHEVAKDTIISSVNNKVYLRGSDNTYCNTGSSGNSVFSLNGSNIRGEGNIETLLDYQTVLNGEHPVMGEYCFRRLFRNCTNLILPPELPATKLVSSCYYQMFAGCTSLTQAPELPATALTSNCYYQMFYNCISLITAPRLPATTLARSCYEGMFQRCQSLTQTPLLPSTTLANSCYRYMFNRCISLILPPELPATTLAGSCYCYMFFECTNLATAPELPATMLAEACYLGMFTSCTSLTTVPRILPATTLASQCYNIMFKGCTSLTSIPELPATTLASHCYREMFGGCTNLTTAPALPATTLVEYCYYKMFSGCINLATAPELSATTLTENCYNSMFNGCTSIKLSTTQTGDYTTNYRIPSGTAMGTAPTNALTDMFTNTGGTFTGTPTINTTYYTSNEIVYPLTFTVDSNTQEYLIFVQDTPTSISTNQTITFRVRADTTQGDRYITAVSQLGYTQVMVTYLNYMGDYAEYEVTIAAPTGCDVIHLSCPRKANPTPY